MPGGLASPPPLRHTEVPARGYPSRNAWRLHPCFPDCANSRRSRRQRSPPSMDLPHLHGLVPPLPTPLKGDETIDVDALVRLVDFQIEAGVHGLWILGTTARFDLIPDGHQRVVAEAAVEAAGGRVPMVLNVSDQGTRRTLERARMFDDLPYDYYAALPPWYQPMTAGEVADYFQALADQVARPLVIYNAPWVCNQLGFDPLRRLAEHPRIVGCKDVSPSLSRALDWPA